MAYDSKKKSQLVLMNHPALGTIGVEVEAFFELSFWLAEELEDLVAEWRSFSVPNSYPARPSSSPPRS